MKFWLSFTQSDKVAESFEARDLSSSIFYGAEIDYLSEASHFCPVMCYVIQVSFHKPQLIIICKMICYNLII